MKIPRPNINRLLRAASLLLIMAGTGLVYYHSNPHGNSGFDYTRRIAHSLLQGELGPTEAPPGWLNEMIPFEGRFYTVFPLGAVLCMIPVALLNQFNWIVGFPSRLIVALLAAFIALFALLLNRRYCLGRRQSATLFLFLLFGNWTWANLPFGGAWHIALGFAVVGQLGALYFTLANKRPFLAGLCFAIAFGNRTEVILTAPIFLAFLWKSSSNYRSFLRDAALFCAVPFMLGSATLVYNYLRFHSPLDFGKARIPGVLDEPWYRHGIFSIYAIPANFEEMLLRPWRRIVGFPYFVPTGWGGSIFLASPFLVYAMRIRRCIPFRSLMAWAAIIPLTFVLWCHGNAGGWQYSYRYAMVLLPWFYLILLETSEANAKGERYHALLLLASLLISAWGTYIFLWTRYMSV